MSNSEGGSPLELAKRVSDQEEEIERLRYNARQQEKLSVKADSELRLKNIAGDCLELSLELLPDACGILVADHWGGDEIRPANVAPLHASRRRVLTLKFARKAAQRLHDLTDPRLS